MFPRLPPAFRLFTLLTGWEADRRASALLARPSAHPARNMANQYL